MKNKKLLLFFLQLIIIFNNSLFANIVIKSCYNNITTEKPLDPNFIESAKEHNKDLKDSCYFDRDFLNKTKDLRKLLNLQTFNIEKDGFCLHYSLIDRNSNKLMVIGAGFPVPREKMAPFIKLFPNYDLLIFDYRGLGFDHTMGWNVLYPWNWLGGLAYKLFKADLNISHIGTKEDDDLICIINEVKTKKNYEKIFGLGLCFSSFVFVKAQSLNPKLFDKLILDGSWPSLKLVAQKIAKSPSLLCSVHNPHSPIGCLTEKESFQNFLIKFIQKIADTDFDSVELMKNYLSKIDIPILFFQSRNDCYCSPQEFDELWQAVKPNKSAIFTEEPHGRNHVYQREIYKEISNLFLEQENSDFTTFLMAN